MFIISGENTNDIFINETSSTGKIFLSFEVLIFTRENISHFPRLGETAVAGCASLLINVQP